MPLRRDRPSSNAILAALPPSEREHLATIMQEMPLRERQVLYEAGERVDRLIFPHSGLVSLVVAMLDGHTVEGAMIGCEGAVGIHALTPSDPAPMRVVVQVAGEASWASIDAIGALYPQLPHLPPIMARYASVAFSRAMQTAACNAVHPARARLAHWLLLAADHTGRERFSLTQEFMAEMLGVSRTQLSTLLNLMRDEALVRYTRADIAIADRDGLEEAACECYETVRDMVESLLASYEVLSADVQDGAMR